jgi:hypothetical protein
MGRSSRDRERRRSRDSSPSQYDTPIGFEDAGGSPRDYSSSVDDEDDAEYYDDDESQNNNNNSPRIESTGFTVTSWTLGACFSKYPLFPGRYCRPVAKPKLLVELDEYTWWSFIAAVNDELRNHTFMAVATLFIVSFYLAFLGSLYVAWGIKKTAGDLLLRDTIVLSGSAACGVILLIVAAFSYHRQTQELHQGLSQVATQWSQVFMREGFDVVYVKVRKSLLFVFSWHESRLVFRRYLPREVEETLETIVEVEVPSKPVKPKSSILPSLKIPKRNTKKKAKEPLTSPQSALDFPQTPEEQLLPEPRKLRYPVDVELQPPSRPKRSSNDKKRFLMI